MFKINSVAKNFKPFLNSQLLLVAEYLKCVTVALTSVKDLITAESGDDPLWLLRYK